MKTATLMLIGLVLTGCATSGPGPTPPPEDSFERTRRMIDDARSLALPEGNYRVEVERVWLGESDAWAIGAILDYDDNTTAVRVGRPVRDPGFRVRVGGDKFRARLSGTLDKTRSSERTQASIVTLPDSPAYLEVGEVRQGATIDFGPRRTTIVVGPGQFVGTALEVVVSPAGPGQATLRLTPSFSERGRRGSTLVTEMSTTVRVPLDRPVLIGSHDQTTDDVASTLLSRSSSRGRQQAVIVLTVTGGAGR